MVAAALSSTAPGPLTRVSRAARGDLQLTAAVVVLLLFVALAITGGILWSTAEQVHLIDALEAPSAAHLLGTDAQGRDVFARVAAGTIVSFGAALAAVLVGAAIGLLVALACGLGPSWLDTLLMRIADAVLAFPQLLLALAISVALGTGLISATIGITVTVIPVFARTLRGEALRSRTEPFVEAARTIGVPTPVIAVRHVIPYLATTLTIQVASNFGAAVLTLAGLSFIGVGVQAPTPEWGAMITDGLQNALTGQWWIGVSPGVALLLVVVALNLVADRLRAISRTGAAA